jgi:hypothetical protein
VVHLTLQLIVLALWELSGTDLTPHGGELGQCFNASGRNSVCSGAFDLTLGQCIRSMPSAFDCH